jgi:glycerophosphoryl diester phosphodiesterase
MTAYAYPAGKDGLLVRQFLLRLFLLLLIILVIFGVYRLLTIRPLDNIAFFRDQVPLAAVDSGAPAGAPPYSAAAFDAAKEAGANALYLPVTLSRDGVLVVTDADASRATLAELRSANASSSAVTLQETLVAYPDLRALVVVRQPSLQALAALLHAVDASDARARVLAAVDHPLLAHTLREQAPDLGTATTTTETNAFLTTQRFGLTPFYRPAAPAMLLEGSQINKRLIDAARNRGIHLVALPDQQSSAAVQLLIDATVDGVVVTDPTLLAEMQWPSQNPEAD